MKVITLWQPWATCASHHGNQRGCVRRIESDVLWYLPSGEDVQAKLEEATRRTATLSSAGRGDADRQYNSSPSARDQEKTGRALYSIEGQENGFLALDARTGGNHHG